MWHACPHRPYAHILTDVLEGYAGALYRRHYIELDQLAHLSAGPPDARYADDVWISGLLASWGIPRLVAPLHPLGLGGGRGGGEDAEGQRVGVRAQEGLSLEYMFSVVWRQAVSQEYALKGHPLRAERNRNTARFFHGFWGPVPFQ
jgi:hypothetical protein